jgi:hypothetical protein
MNTLHSSLIVGLALVSACTSDTSDVARVSAELRPTNPDPSFIDAAITIESIYLQSETHGEVVLFDGSATIDLVDLPAAAVALVNDVEVPAGEYEQLRFVISGGYLEVVDDDGTARLYATADYPFVPRAPDGELRVPSFATSGLKVQLHGLSAFDSEQELVVVDFDVAESFGHQAGGSGAWVMHPVVSANEVELSMGVDVVVRSVDPLLTAEVLANVEIDLVDASGEIIGSTTLADAEGDGVFVAHFDFIDSRRGPFTLELSGSVAVTAPALPIAIEPNPGSTTVVELEVVSL